MDRVHSDRAVVRVGTGPPSEASWRLRSSHSENAGRTHPEFFSPQSRICARSPLPFPRPPVPSHLSAVRPRSVPASSSFPKQVSRSLRRPLPRPHSSLLWVFSEPRREGLRGLPTGRHSALTGLQGLATAEAPREAGPRCEISVPGMLKLSPLLSADLARRSL